jgi:hypothetical protein
MAQIFQTCPTCIVSFIVFTDNFELSVLRAAVLSIQALTTHPVQTKSLVTV